jgi:hypothetical protein
VGLLGLVVIEDGWWLVAGRLRILRHDAQRKELSFFLGILQISFLSQSLAQPTARQQKNIRHATRNGKKKKKK